MKVSKTEIRFSTTKIRFSKKTGFNIPIEDCKKINDIV